MTKFYRITSPRLELYFLPEGAERGKDEIPVHSNASRFAMNFEQEMPEISYHDHFKTFTPTIKRVSFDLSSIGQPRDLPQLWQPGARGILTVLEGTQGQFARHCNVIMTSLNIGSSFDELWSYESSFVATGTVYDGTYTCEHQYGRIRSDRGDGTFLERPLIHMLPFDELINNRYGWT